MSLSRFLSRLLLRLVSLSLSFLPPSHFLCLFPLSRLSDFWFPLHHCPISATISTILSNHALSIEGPTSPLPRGLNSEEGVFLARIRHAMGERVFQQLTKNGTASKEEMFQVSIDWMRRKEHGREKRLYLRESEANTANAKQIVRFSRLFFFISLISSLSL